MSSGEPVRPATTAASEAAERQHLEHFVELHREHPAVQRWYRKVHLFECPMPGAGYFCFLAAVFQDGVHAALVWSDGSETWGTEGWLPLSTDDSFERNLLRLPPVAHGRTFAEILDVIVSLHANVPQPNRPWWRFWR